MGIKSTLAIGKTSWRCDSSISWRCDGGWIGIWFNGYGEGTDGDGVMEGGWFDDMERRWDGGNDEYGAGIDSDGEESGAEVN